MGASCCNISTFFNLEISEWINIIGLIINALLAVWIVYTIQNKLENKRVLKNHFIEEIKEIRSEYRKILDNLYANRMNPKSVMPWFKLMNIKISDLMDLMFLKYKVDKKSLKPYQIDLQELITENKEFISQFKSIESLKFSEKSRNLIVKFQQDHNHLFNDLIVKINDAN